MKQIPYHCTRPKAFLEVDGVRANYDGEVFTATRGGMQAGITAAKGETVYVTVGDSGAILCSTKKRKDDGS